MSNITDWIKQELYPSLSESIDIALPELQFTRRSGKWISPLNRDGSKPKKSRRDKTVVSIKAPGWIIENGERGSISLIDYVMQRDGVEFIQAVKALAEIAGIEIPARGDIDQESYQKYSNQATLLEDCNSYFIYCLENAKGAEEVRGYITGRGYTEEDIKAMELGYIPSQEKLFKHLLSLGHTQELIDQSLQTDREGIYKPLAKGIGSTHSLTIPYRSGGTLKGFKFRTTGDAQPKYLNTTGLDKLGGFFNLTGVRGDKDLVIVEGELDSLSATARGVGNVVALGGNTISPDQVKDARKRGAKSFTLCFDTEPGKEEETAERVIRASGVILDAGGNKVYIVTLPDLGEGKTDPDRLIKERGVEAFKEALHGRLTYGAYIGNRLLEDYYSKAKDRFIDYKDRDLLREKVVEIRYTLSAQDRIDFNRHLVEPLAELGHGFTEEILSDLEESHRTAIEEAKRARKIDEILREAGKLQDPAHKLGRIKEGIKEVDAISGKGLLPPPVSYTTLLSDIATLPPAYKTGYSSLDEFIGFTPGAITLIAGRPSHGKTTFMFNLLLEMSDIYPDQIFYFFTYEEPLKNIAVKLLNRLINEDLIGYFRDARDLSKPTNYEFIKHYIRTGRTDIPGIEQGKELLRELIDGQRIRIIDRNYSVEQLSSLIAYLRKRERIGALIIDYIQRMSTERRTQDKRTEIAHISDQVLQIAKESGLPIILGAQLNREASSEPRLENIKEAGNLEEDANTVISVYCKAREEEETETGEKSSGINTVELKLKTLKNREGEVNRIQILDWDRWTGVIRDRQKTEDPFKITPK